MSTITKPEELVFDLPVADRAKLAERLWQSIPEDYINEDDLQEALRRDREMDEDPSKVISNDEFFQFFKDRRK